MTVFLHRLCSFLIVLTFPCVLAGCATALPSFNGGSITPHQRTDTIIGASAKIKALSTQASSTELKRVSPSNLNGSEGLAPAASASYGLTPEMDIGLLFSGSTAQLHWRREWLRKNKPTRAAWVLGIKPFLGWNASNFEAENSEDHGVTTGVEIPFLYALEVSGIFELWTGFKLGLQYNHTWHSKNTFENGQQVMFSDAQPNDETSTFIVRPGGVFGIGTGFRRVHILLEVTSYYEYWNVDIGGKNQTEHAWTFVPAFGLRIRI